jgi:hypothetical protein
MCDCELCTRRIKQLETVQSGWLLQFRDGLKDGKIEHVETRNGKPIYRDFS